MPSHANLQAYVYSEGSDQLAHLHFDDSLIRSFLSTNRIIGYYREWSVLTLEMPRKPASENIVCGIFLQTFQTYFCVQAN